MSWPEMAIVSVTVLIGATLQGSVGFGMGLLASPILILIDERFVPAPILLSTLVLTTFLTLRERHAIDLHGLRWALTGRVVGTFVAGAVLVVLPADRMAIVFGGFVLVGVLMSASGRRFQPRPRTLATAGMLSGIMGTIASMVDLRWPWCIRTRKGRAYERRCRAFSGSERFSLSWPYVLSDASEAKRSA